jgi:hypothetical protein
MKGPKFKVFGTIRSNTEKEKVKTIFDSLVQRILVTLKTVIRLKSTLVWVVNKVEK